MKKQHLSTLAGIIAALLLTTNLFSQKSSPSLLAKNLTSVVEIDKANFSIDEALLNKKLTNAFMARFKNGSDEKWYQVGKQYLVEFTREQKKVRALFNNNGAWMYTVNYGAENDLPARIRDVVRSSYYGYAITSAIEVNQSERNIWVIRLENDKTLVHVRVEDGEFEEVQKIVKS